MESAGGTASLRKTAAHWSLAGDKQLLNLLESFHERILTKCQEANSGLDDMVKSLDSASISLQNVNNRFMALSNSKFVESRVYEDEPEPAAQEPPVKEPPKPPEASTEMARLRESLRVLESYHEAVHILDSDSETASDDEEERMVFRPKDLYAERPLPYVIGSQQWRTKWHAGLVVEASESDSSASGRSRRSEQYSESEPEGDVRTDKPHASQRTISTTSSMGSELTVPPAGKPADVAAALGGGVPQMPEPEPESPPTGPPPTTAYRPQRPTIATIFPDEPPPLDASQSERWSQSESDSEDVFAELHRRPPAPADRDASYAYGNRGVFGDAATSQPNPPVKRSSPLFDEPHDSELFADTPESEPRPAAVETPPESPFKKPVGGISLFGNNKGAESIGAAILKRHQRKDSTSDDEIPRPPLMKNVDSTENSREVKAKTDDKSKDKIQKDIINDLFAKSNKNNQPNKKVVKISTEKVEKPANKKVDLFTDDLFDDIDDIFTNVKPSVKETKENTKKSLFDDDEDDLFANVAVSKNKMSSKAESKSKSIFDSDDDLFSEQNEENNAPKSNNVIAPDRVSSAVTDRSDGIKSVTQDVIKKVQATKSDNIETVHEKPATDWKSEYKDIVPSRSVTTTHIQVKHVQDNSLDTGSKVKGIFDSDSDDDIFSDLKSSNDKIINNQKSKNDIIDKKEKKEDPESTSNNSEDALFLPQEPTSKMKQSSSKIGFDVPQNKNTKTILDKENEDLDEDDSLFKQIKSSTHQISSKDKNDFDEDEFEDDNKKTEKEVLTSIENSPKVEDNAMTTSENKLFSSLVKNDNRLQNKKVSNTQLQSPALFDEDDDLDDIFSKSPKSHRAKEISDKLENANPNLIKPSKLTNKDDTISIGESTNLHTKVLNETKIEESINTEADLVFKENLDESVVNKSDIIEDPALETNTLIQSSQQKDESKEKEIGAKVINKPELAHDDDIQEELFTPNIEDEVKKENKTEYFIEQEPLYPEANEFVPDGPDTLSDIDIFSDVPPEFEKPKEPKKSKNVNALFDDDSDDEALFFKKNDLMTDEKPDVTFSPQEDRLFHIFHDEPPAIDVDFTQKPKKSTSLNLATPPSDTHSDMDLSKTVTEEKNKDPIPITDPELENIIDEAKKPVGKLKPMNFNINVSTLLPGASPKKVKNYEQVDGQIISTKTTEDVAIDSDSRIVKSVSFEGDPDSEVLDNKLSKERAKIQVKRRPSSRRARKEAVRKSGIDFGDDSTDNSSSTDISRKDNLSEKCDDLHVNNISDSIQNDLLPSLTNTQEKQEVVIDYEEKDANIFDIFTKNMEDFTTGSKSNIAEEHYKSHKKEDTTLMTNATESTENMKDNYNTGKTRAELQENNDLSTGFNKRPNVKSKVVYILNDEDIFTDTKPTTSVLVNKDKSMENTQETTKNKVLDIVQDDDDDLFMSSTSKASNIATIGNVYKDVASKDKQIDNFDSDEDIFKASQSKAIKDSTKDNKTTDSKEVIDKMEAKIDKLFVKSQSAKHKSSLFDDLSDDESELFGNKKSVKTSKEKDGASDSIKKDVRLLKNAAKKPLFGDVSDDDDLFGVKTSKREPFQPVSKSAEVTSTPREPVFEDPLSILGQEDDM